ncbi:uncharacterized protein LOC125531296 isoform X2 [Triticum urartu]|uniref:uncharacterized protein LOC125531296 isoform X2 n=1 Tax=Triticum urartu TaxID=4572 RepID=UPI00204356B9|nr:uncharacterized protein LOC125531296 isoform X2 [Triticum urartu]
MGRFMAELLLLLALVASNSWHGAVVGLHGHGVADDKASVVMPKHDISLASFTDKSSSYLGLIGGLANLPLGRNTMVYAAPVLSAYDLAADAKPVKRALAMGALVDFAHEKAKNTVGAVTSNGKPGDKSRLVPGKRTICSCKETFDDTLVLAGKPTTLSEQPIRKGKASQYLSLLHGSKQVLTARDKQGSAYGVMTGSAGMIYEAVLTAFAAAAIIACGCWGIVTRTSLSQKERTVLVLVLILSSMTHVGCVDDGDDDDYEDPDPNPPVQGGGAGNNPQPGAAPTQIEGLVNVAVDFHMSDEAGGALFLIQYEEQMGDNTEPITGGHYITPPEVAKPLRWITVGLPLPDTQVFASLLVRGDKGYNMGFINGYGLACCTSDAKGDKVFPFDVEGCEDLGFASDYRGLTDTPKGDINAALEIEIGQDVALKAARVLAEYGHSHRAKELTRQAMRDLTVMVCEGPRINRIGDIMKHRWTTRTRLVKDAVRLIFKWKLMSVHKCIGKDMVGKVNGGWKLIAIGIKTLVDIDRELGMVKYSRACDRIRFPRQN